MAARAGATHVRSREHRIAGAGEQPYDLLGEVIEALSEGLAIFDENACLVRCNAGYLGLNPTLTGIIVRGVTWDMLLRESVTRGAMSPSARDRLQWMEARLADGDRYVQPLELEAANGRTHEIGIRQTATGGFLVTQRDITERRKLEDNEREADVLLRKVLEACPANVVMSRVGDGRIIYRSPAATELFGPARHSHEHFAAREERADFITALLPDGRVDDMPVTGVRPDGTHFPCLVSARLIEYRGEEVVVSSTVDITKEMDMRRTLAEQREQIFQAEKMSALGELLAGVAHELNNPLSVVVGHALMMRDETADPETLRRIEKISDAAERCARIVKSFLAMARQQPAKLSAIDLSETLDMAIDALQQGADGLDTPVETDVPEDLPPIHADAHQIAQVLINLVKNADQAIRDSGTGDLIRISARFDKAAQAVDIRVADNGPGIPEKIRSRIFDPLFTTKEVGQGTGIGLAFCHRVVTAHSGLIRVEPPTAEGATIFIRLPIAATGTAPQSEAGTTEEGEARGSILVVDDEPDVADLIREILTKDGYEVDSAASAREAIGLLRERTYSLVLSDLNMPGMNGREFYETIQRDFPGLARRVGFVTGDTMSPQVRGFLESAGCPFLEKPIAPGELRKLAHKMQEAMQNPGGPG
ncbi:hybrid sensor histidine kinase/response regulator [Ostreiculturibacter nitratireducens]|uniref:hybrid sensor histidine kinase/response regulator n=1 Tax=Ostreiculturibacter nitratireducens TaxID=3075226 RepID=UPI0031B62E8E